MDQPTSKHLARWIDVADNYHDMVERLKVLVEPIAQALDYTEVTSVDIENGNVTFKAEWYGSYQSHDYEVFTFPLFQLLDGTDAIIQRFRDERAKAKQAKDAEATQRELELYEQLRAKFEAKP